MQILDNVNKTVKDDLVATIGKGDKLSIAAACFSIYAYQALKKQLDGIAELRFIFTSPTFLQEKAPKAKREFYILGHDARAQLNRERSLYGTDFEVKLRNELTQKAIARECAEWIKKKVKFRFRAARRCATQSADWYKRRDSRSARNRVGNHRRANARILGLLPFGR